MSVVKLNFSAVISWPLLVRDARPLTGIEWLGGLDGISQLAGQRIVSRLARGVDVGSHRGALSAVNGATIGVLGCGIHLVYPKESKKISEEIEQGGPLISEFPMGTFPAPQTDCGRAPHGVRTRKYSVGNATTAVQPRPESAQQTGSQARDELGGRD
jgi:DNA recombination-mediator protein A